MTTQQQPEFQNVTKRILPDFCLSIEDAPPDKLKNLVYLFINDIEQYRKKEEFLQECLQEKNLLLQEVHHRVKNDFQRVYTLLSLQERESDDPRTSDALRESMNRLLSMMSIYERLYQSSSVKEVDFGEFLYDFCADLLHTYNASRIKLLVDNGVTLVLPVKKATSCALILNELVTNSLKHAFDDGREGELRISVQDKEDGHLMLEISDNGKGLPDGIQIHELHSLGLQVVHQIVTRQLHGDLKMENEGGAVFRITFPK